MTSEQKMTRLLLQASEDLQKIHDQLIKELSKVAAQNIDAVTPNEFYSIAEACTHAQKAKVQALLDEYRDMVVSLAERGMTRAVSLSASNSQLLLAQYTKFTGEETEKWREKTAKAFIQSRMKRDKGLSLSDRVWNYTQQTKAEFELAVSQAIEDGISKGTSAEKLGRRVREHLNNPDMMYRRYHRKKVLADGTKKDIVEWRRRVIGADGKVHFVKEDLAAVGTGVYRSARQNALRLTITETNMAYNYANCKRWTEEPFVLGIRIRLSGNHPAPDICDTLQGEYPRDFMWRGWHPRCRCSQSPILMDRDSDEWKKLRAMDADEYKKYKSPNRITAAPAAFQEWCKKNKEKLTKAREAGKLPYFVRDNEKAVGKLLGWKNAEPTKGAALTKQEEIKARAAQRHANRTPEEIADIRRRAKEREDRHALMRKTAANVLKAAADYPEVSLDALRKAIKADNLDAMYALAKQTARQLAPIKKDERALSVLIPDVHEWRKQFSSAELHKVYKSVESSLKEWSALPLEEQAENLKYMWSELLGGNKYGVQSRYKEWKVAQAAFKRKYTQVVDAIDWRKIDSTLEAAKAFQTKSQQYRALVGKLEAAVTAKDKAEAQKVIADILKKREQLEKAAAARTAKKTEVISAARRAEISAAAKVRHAARTPEREAELQEYREWKKQLGKNAVFREKYETREQINETFKKLNEMVKNKWFEHGDLDLRIETDPKNNGSTTMNGVIYLTAKRMERVKSAMTKIGSCKWGKITEDEADAMATLWHEITHNRNKLTWDKYGNFQWRYFFKRNGDYDKRRFMELANEYVARNTLPEFYRALGLPVTPYDKFIKFRDTTGYNAMVTNYDWCVSELNLDANKVLDEVRRNLYDGSYRELKAGLMKGLQAGGIKKKDGTAVKVNVLSDLLSKIKNTLDEESADRERCLKAWLERHGLL